MSDTTTLTISFDDLTGAGRPAGWTVEDHAGGEGVVVWAPTAIDGLLVRPGQQLNYERDDDGVVLAYSTGPDEGEPADTGDRDDEEPAVAEPEIEPDVEPDVEPEPEPEPEPEAEVPAGDPLDDRTFPQPTGGGWYLLSDGTKVQGEDAALEAQVALNEDAD